MRYVDDANDTFALLGMPNAAERDEPRPLIPSEAVKVNSGWRNRPAGLCAYNQTEAVIDKSLAKTIAKEQGGFLAHLCSGMNIAEKLVGSTRLEPVEKKL